MKRAVLVLVAFAFFATGCATTSPRASYRDVDTMVRERIGASAQPADAPSLDGEIDVQRAVALALANNAMLKARAEELGIAHADLVQAGLASNPKVHASFRFPDGGGAEATGTEAGIDLDLLDVITRPMKKQMASRQLEQAKLRLGHEILKLAVDVKTAFYAYQAAAARLALRRTAVESLKTETELAEKQQEAGNISAVELANRRAAQQEAAMELRHDETDMAVDREKLALLMGVQDRGPLRVAPELSPIPASSPELAKLEALALARRWDLQAARREPAVLGDALKISKLNILTGFEAGVDSERDFGGERGLGPDATIPIPVFDRRQGANAKVRAQIRQSRHTLAALEQEVRYDVRAAHTQLATARQDVQTYRKDILPLRHELVEETLKRYNFMLEGVYQLLAARRSELDAQRALIDAEKNYWTRWAELERAVGGRVE